MRQERAWPEVPASCYMEAMRNLVLSSALLLVAACESKSAPAPEPSTPTVAPTAQTPETDGVRQEAKAAPENPHAGQDPSAALPAGHPPVEAQPKAEAAPLDPSTLPPPSAGGLTWTAPKPLVRKAPKNAMRVAEYGIEGSPASELAVFYFGADQGGSVEANITRWVGQLSQPSGGETKPKRSEKKVKGTEVSLVEATGTYSGGMAMPGSAVPAEQTDATLLGAIAKGPQGSVFFKLVGPKKDVEGARKAFNGMIDSLKAEGAAK